MAALLLAAGAPVVAAGATAAEAKERTGGSPASSDHVAPGQEKKAATTEPGAVAPPPGPTATNVSPTTGKDAKPLKPSQTAKAPPKSQPSAPAPSGQPTTSVAPAAAPATPVATSTPASTAAPAPANAARAPGSSTGTSRRSGRTSRTRPPARTGAGRLAPARLPAPLGLPAALQPGLAAATFVKAAAPTSSPAGSPAGPFRDAPGADSPLTRTVVRVLEVVPQRLRLALALLAGLGLLLGAATVVQTLRRRGLERQRRLLVADVGVLQSALLPELPEQIGGARVTAAYRPAEGLAAGGDFYDAFELPGGRTAVLVGDVAGHGREVVPLTALVRYNLRAYLEAGLTPRSTLHVAANVLEAHLGDRQVSIAVAIFDPGMGRLTYACAGHAPPLLLGGRTVPVTASSSPPIGAGAPTGRRQTTIALPPASAVCFHTDGLDEAPVAAGRLGREAVAEELAAVGAQGDAAELIARIVQRSKRQPDDMAACILTALPGGSERWYLQLEELEVDDAALRGGWADRFLGACGVEAHRRARALLQAREIIDRDGTAVVEVRLGEALAEVRVTAPPAVMLPVERRATGSNVAAATGGALPVTAGQTAS